jgi:hypothetical protein
MPKLVKIAFIAVVAALAISATRLIPHDARDAGGPDMSAYSESSLYVSPLDMMKAAGPLPETKVEDYN